MRRLKLYAAVSLVALAAGFVALFDREMEQAFDLIGD